MEMSNLVQSASKGSNFDTNVYTKSAPPKGAINLGLGSPNYHGSAVARKACNSLMNNAEPGVHQYSATKGHHILRDAIRKYYNRTFAWDFEIDNVVVTSGASEALLCSLITCCNPGDEVVYFQPFFPPYASMVNTVSAVNIVIPLKLINDQMRPDFDLLEKSITKRTKLIIWNTPHNPAGFVATKDELQTLSNIVKKHDLTLISDEVYEAHTFPSQMNEHLRIARLEGMWERTITLGSASKRFSLTGWRVGWAIGPAKLLARLNAVHTLSTYCSPTPLQLSISHAFNDQENMDTKNISKLLESNYIELARAFKSIGLLPLKVEGGHFLPVDVTNSGSTAVEFTKLLAEHGVIVFPMNRYCQGKGGMYMIRVALCKTLECVREGARRIRKMKTVFKNQESRILESKGKL